MRMQTSNDFSRCLIPLNPESTLIAVIEMSQSSWLVAGFVPGVERQPLKKLEADEGALLKLLVRWRQEAEKAGHKIDRMVVAFEAGRDGFWLARWLIREGIEAYVMHASSIAVSREHRRAKTDRLDTEMLKRAFLGWLRGERDHCRMVAIPSTTAEDAKRPHRERESLVKEVTRIVNRMKAALSRLGIRGFNPKLKKATERLDGLATPEGEPIPPNTKAELRRDMARRRLIQDQIKEIEAARLAELAHAPAAGHNPMVSLLARVVGVGIETADMLVREALSRNLRDRRAVARYAGLTGSPHESGTRRREKGLGPIRQCPCPHRHDPVGLAHPQVPTRLRAGQMVPGPNRERTQDPQDNDCRDGAQAADRAMAARARRCGSRRRRSASGTINGGVHTISALSATTR